MNEEQKRQEKIDKFGRQLGFTAYKMLLLSQENSIFVRGNGVYITIKKEGTIERLEDDGENEKVGEEEKEQRTGESEEKCGSKKVEEGEKIHSQEIKSKEQEEIKCQ